MLAVEHGRNVPGRFDRGGWRSYDPGTMRLLPGAPGPRAARRPRDPSEIATTTSYRGAEPAAPPLAETSTSRARVGRQAKVVQGPRRERVTERRAILAVVALVASIVGAAALSRSISDVIETRAQVAEARARNDAIRAQVEASRREVELAQSDAYLRFAARGLGYGRGRERQFALREGAPPPPSITPLGDGLDTQAEDDVLAGFLDLLLAP